jgi:uncharacterized small protein (DUF1192 family)
MSKQVPPQQSDDDLYQLSTIELVNIIKALKAEIERLKEGKTRDRIRASRPNRHPRIANMSALWRKPLKTRSRESRSQTNRAVGCQAN